MCIGGREKHDEIVLIWAKQSFPFVCVEAVESSGLSSESCVYLSVHVHVCWTRQFHRSEFYFSGNLNCCYILEMNDLQCSVSIMGIAASPPGRGAALQHQIQGMPWWAFLCQDPRVPSGPGLASHSHVLWGTRSLSRGVTGCVFAARAGTRGLNLVDLQSFLLQHHLWLLGTGSGAGVVAGWAMTPAGSFISPAFLLNTCWKLMTCGMSCCF